MGSFPFLLDNLARLDFNDRHPSEEPRHLTLSGL